MRVDQKMEKQKRRSSTRKTRPVPQIVIEKLDSTTTNSNSLNNSSASRKSTGEIIKVVENAYEPINNSQAKTTLKRTETINEEDLLIEDNKGSDDSSDESD